MRGKKKMVRIGKAARVGCAVAFALAAGDARAFLETGTLLTNSASATYSAGSQNTSVSYSATAKILVANPQVFLYKDVTLTYVACAGGPVTFTLCFSNGGANTAFKVTITDKLANALTFIDCGPGNYEAWQASGPPVPTLSWSPDGSTWTENCPSGRGTTPGPGDMFYLRWVVDRLDIGESGCVIYAANMM